MTLAKNAFQLKVQIWPCQNLQFIELQNCHLVNLQNYSCQNAYFVKTQKRHCQNLRYIKCAKMSLSKFAHLANTKNDALQIAYLASTRCKSMSKNIFDILQNAYFVNTQKWHCQNLSLLNVQKRYLSKFAHLANTKNDT